MNCYLLLNPLDSQKTKLLKTKTVFFSINNKQFSSNYFKKRQNNNIIANNQVSIRQGIFEVCKSTPNLTVHAACNYICIYKLFHKLSTKVWLDYGAKNKFRNNAEIQYHSRLAFLLGHLNIKPESAPNNSNETYTFMCLGRAGRFCQH